MTNRGGTDARVLAGIAWTVSEPAVPLVVTVTVPDVLDETLADVPGVDQATSFRARVSIMFAASHCRQPTHHDQTETTHDGSLGETP
jgi:hypothetical protein